MGQARKLSRDCPAAGRLLTPAECGDGRMSRYACPETCPFNVWRPEHYPELVQTHDRLDAKVIRELVRDADARGQDLAPPGEDDGLARGDYFFGKLYRERDAQGTTFRDRWAAAKFQGLSNDERLLFCAIAKARVHVIEVRTALDSQTCAAIDLLDDAAGEFRIVDASLAQAAGRFAALVGRMYPTPHFRRMHGIALSIPDVQGLEPLEVLQLVATHLGWSDGTVPLADWLDRHFVQLGEALAAIPPVLAEETLRQSPTRRSVALYRLAVKANGFEKAMDAWPEAHPEELPPELASRGFRRSWTWVTASPNAPASGLIPNGALAVIGTVSLAEQQVVVTMEIGQDADRVRADFERFAGKQLTFEGAREDDLGAQMAAGTATTRQRELVPPDVVARARRYQITVSRTPRTQESSPTPGSLRHGFARAWLDEPVPALGGLTPRQAAADPDRRPVLALIVKGIIRTTDAKQLNEGGEEDPGDLARELGLAELDVPPPPALYPPPRPVLPPLPTAPLSREDVDARLDALVGSLEMDTLLARFEAECPELLEAVELLQENTRRDWPAVVDMLLALAWFILFPSPVVVSLPSAEELAKRATKELERWLAQSCTATPNHIDDLLHSRQQPDLVMTLISQIFAATEGPSKKPRLDMQTAMEMALVLRVLVDLMDGLARPRQGRPT